MAHGFLTPESVSGDNFWKNAKDLWDLLQRLKKRKAPPEEVVPAVVSELQNALPPGKENLLPSGKQQSANKPKALNMLKGSPVAKMLGSGKSEITIKQQLALPPGGPKLPPGASPAGKGGTFTNLPGISAAPKKLDSEAFFKAAQTGVHPETGQYLTSDERKNYLKKSKATMNAPASVASAGAAGISSIGEVTKGDEQIVGSVKDLTKVVVSLVNAVKSQTAAQAKASSAQKASAERTANRALASAEESSLEQGSDLSGTITPTYGTNSGTLLPPGAGGGGGGAGGPGFGIGGKAVAQAVGKRGLGRALPRLGAHVAGKTGAKLGAQFGAKAAAKIGAGAVGKSLAKKIPGLGLLAGLGFGAQRLFQGDILGAAGEVASGAASTVPGLGTAASVGIDAALAARDMGVTPFAAGGIISSPTLSLTGEKGKEGVFPLQGKEGKKTFEMFGQGMIDAQKKNRRDYANIQAAGLKQYYENQDGGKVLAKAFVDIFKGIGGALASLFGGNANAKENPMNPADYLDQAAGGQDMMTLATIAALESGSAQGQADVAQSVYNRLADKTYGSSITDILTRQGQYQVAFKDPTAKSGAGTQVADVFKNIKTEDDAVKAMMYYYNKRGQKITAEQARQKLRGSVAAIQNTELQKKAAAHVGGRTEFLARGQGRAGSVSRGGGSDNDFFAAYGSGKQMARGAAPVPLGISGGGTNGALDMSRLPPLPKTDTLGGGVQRYGASRDKGTRRHAGVDFDISGNQKFYSRIGGVVVSGPFRYGDDGWGIDIYNKQLGVYERIAEAAKILVTPGDQIRPGQAVAQGESRTGVIHYEIRKKQSGGFENSLNPLNFLNALQRNAGGAGGGGASGPVASKPKTKADLIGSAQPANQNNGTAMMATSAQVQMGAMGLTTSGGNVINNIYNTGGQQSSPMGNTLSAGTPSGNAGLSWLALVRR